MLEKYLAQGFFFVCFPLSPGGTDIGGAELKVGTTTNSVCSLSGVIVILLTRKLSQPPREHLGSGFAVPEILSWA